MKTRNIVLALGALALFGAGGYGLYRLGVSQGAQSAPPQAKAAEAKTGMTGPATGRTILYWHDPMVPGTRFDKPGKSPYMDMPLVPVYADAAGDGSSVSISPRVQQNLGIRTAQVTRGRLAAALEAVGSVAFNERDVALVQARSNGFVERLAVRAPLDRVRRGQALAELYVPDWIAAQEEYLAVRRMRGGDELVAAARQRMALAGMSEAQIRQVEASGKTHARVTLTAPVSGVVTELAAREGMTVMAGAPLFRINGLDTVWVNAEVPENAASRLRPGMEIEARSAALPQTLFKGRIGAILPDVNPATRTLKARVELANTGGQLVPGMFVTVGFAPAAGEEVLLVPAEAVIRTGRRDVVIVAQDDGKFAPVDVETGAEANGQTEIRKGLDAGQKVVVSGQFLIDSEASLKGSANRMGAGQAPDAKKAGLPLHRGEGKVEFISQDTITISHGPIVSLQWDAMTMDFKLPANALPKGIGVGDTVAFEFRQTADGEFEIAGMKRLAAAPPQEHEHEHQHDSGGHK
ncbi:MAG: efflux RND transporter periplasmic adaptor subunit [Bacillota bacterium]